jgi:hypothetical protein
MVPSTRHLRWRCLASVALLVDESAYFDKKHARKSYAHEAGHVLTNLPDP